MINIGLYGDSILAGVQINPENKKYYINNVFVEELLREKFSLQIRNYSSFGCTVTKGKNILEKRLEANNRYDAIIMDYGGNDCDYNWKAISENPLGNFIPNTPIEMFTDIYCGMIDTIKEKGILPILTTLPPLQPQRFFDWFCRELNKTNILEWLGDIKNIYYHQENYSKAIEKIALEKQVPLVDLRREFLKSGDVDAILCEDGTHPNTLGQKIIASSFHDFANRFLQA